MCAEPDLRVANIRSLRHVSKSKPGPYVSRKLIVFTLDVLKVENFCIFL